VCMQNMVHIRITGHVFVATAGRMQRAKQNVLRCSPAAFAASFTAGMPGTSTAPSQAR
jgi:hypothetical protein